MSKFTPLPIPLDQNNHHYQGVTGPQIEGATLYYAEIPTTGPDQWHPSRGAKMDENALAGSVIAAQRKS
jgi:hypothetical protein